jgi:hypothetical protein
MHARMDNMDATLLPTRPNFDTRRGNPITTADGRSSLRKKPGFRLVLAFVRSSVSVVAGLAEGEGDVAVFDHVLDLSPHCRWLSGQSHPATGLAQSKGRQEALTRQRKQNQPVHHQHGPKNGNVEDLEPRAQEANRNRPRRAMPELELGQPSDKRAELLVLLRWQRGSRVAVLEPFVLRERGVEFRLQEREEEVEEVDAERVRDYVPALREDDAQEEEEG